MSSAPSDPVQRRVACILGLPIDVVDMAETVRHVREAVRTRTRLFLSTPNLNFAIMALEDSEFRDSVIDSDLSIADGMPLVWVARVLSVKLPERVAGSALLEALRAGSAETPIKVYFFGGQDGVAEVAAQRLNEEPSGLTCVGWISPGLGSADQLSRPEWIEQINASGADFLVVSLGAKKGQAWIQRNRAHLSVPVISHLGAALNFVAGTAQRAPAWIQRSGLEWLWRIKEEPALWRRYFGDGLAFLKVVLLHVLPLAWSMRRRGVLPANAPVSIDTDILSDCALVKVAGAWTNSTSVLLRDELIRASMARGDVALDLSALDFADMDLLGALLQALQVIRRSGNRSIRVVAARPDVLAIMQRACVDYLVDLAPGATARSGVGVSRVRPT